MNTDIVAGCMGLLYPRAEHRLGHVEQFLSNGPWVNADADGYDRFAERHVEFSASKRPTTDADSVWAKHSHGREYLMISSWPISRLTTWLGRAEDWQ
jgi:hypothetical protein